MYEDQSACLNGVHVYCRRVYKAIHEIKESKVGGESCGPSVLTPIWASLCCQGILPSPHPSAV